MFDEQSFYPNIEPTQKTESPPRHTDQFFPKELPIADFRVGEMITDQYGDQYEVIEKLGEGGYGSVFEILQVRTGLKRALKVIRPESIAELPANKRLENEKRFEREIRALAKFQNPFILPVVDVIEVMIRGKKAMGLVTDLVEGSNLEREMEKGGMPPELVSEYAGEILIALVSMHKVGLIHRDLKPANVFLQKMDDAPDGKQIVRLGDFGLAAFGEMTEEKRKGIPDKWKALQKEQDGRITSTGFVVGSPSHMSPEQVTGEKLTTKSDLYSLGVILYELVTGKPIFESSADHLLMIKHVQDVPESFSKRGVKDVPVWLEEIVMKLLQKKPEDRFASAAEVFAALKAGVKKEYPKMLNEIPFDWDIK